MGTTHYVDINWTQALDLDARIGLEVLEAEVPTFGWRQVYSLGKEVGGQAAHELQTPAELAFGSHGV